MALKAARGALPEHDQVADDGWLYDESFIDSRYGDYLPLVPEVESRLTRAPSDMPTLADITFRRGETVCGLCHLVHRGECP
jgi:hypothetical protein